MTLSISTWNRRYHQQARWTHDLRNYVYQRTAINTSSRILEVGCGTGTILGELSCRPVHSIFGLDINPDAINFSHENVPQAGCIVGDAHNVPCKNNSFDICLCHFLLLWLTDPLQALTEMVRMTRPGGYILALAEPDYGGRIDYPVELSQIGVWQIKSLEAQGANPMIGRELRALFGKSKLINIETGVLGAQWHDDESKEDIALEWEIIKLDFQQIGVSERELSALRVLDDAARSSHHRILYVPTFYAIGQVAK